MANLNGENIGTNYKGIINMENLNEGIGADLRALTDGDGSFLPIKVNNDGNNVVLEISDTDRYIATIDEGSDSGIYLNFANSNFTYGGHKNNGNKLYIDDGSNSVSINSGGNSYFYAQGNTTTIGDVDYSNNATKLSIDDNSSIIKTQHQNNETGLKLDFANETYFLNSGDFGLNVDGANLIIKLGDYLGTANGTSLFIDEANSKIYTKYYDVNTSIFNDIGLKLDFQNQSYSLGDYNNTNNGVKLQVNDNLIKTESQGGDNGLYLDYSNFVYCLGLADGGDYLNTITGFKLDSSNVIIGDTWSNGLTHLAINFADSNIKTFNNTSELGLKLDFANQQYQLGVPNNWDIVIDGAQRVITIGDWEHTADGTHLVIDDTSRLITTKHQSNEIGLKLDFANDEYNFGYVTDKYGLQVDSTNQVISLGDNLGNLANENKFVIDTNNNVTKTSYQGNDIGLKLDFVNQLYRFGDFSGFSLDIDKSNWQIFLGDWDNISNGTLFQLDDANQTIKTLQQGVVDGISIDMPNGLYQLGQVDGGDQVVFKVDGANGKFSTNRLTKPNGILLDIVGTTYSFGQLDGGNGTRLIVNDGVGFPLQVSGVNVLTATSGGSSGQHLKVKINGVDYVIKLENP